MRPVYERENLVITEFESEDVITTSGVVPDPTNPNAAMDNRISTYHSFNRSPNPWF